MLWLCMILISQGNFSYVNNGYDLVDQGSILGSTKFFTPWSFSLLIFGLLLKATHVPYQVCFVLSSSSS